MCLIIAPGQDGKVALLPEEVFQYSFRRNNDGFGAMWVEDGRVQHIKQLGLSQDEEYAKMKELTDNHPDVIFHMRLKTHGRVIPSLCHPFRILNKNRHGKDLFFMHNGVLSSYGNHLTYGQSDTTSFKDRVLVPLLTRNPDALDDPAIWDSINKMTQGSRLIFLDSTGKVYRTSETAWNTRYGLTLSNTYMLPSLQSSYQGGSGNGYGVSYGDDNVYGMGSTAEYDNDRRRMTNRSAKDGYVLWRRVNSGNGASYGAWYKEIVPGLIRSEYGTLYKDRGPHQDLISTVDYVQQAMEQQTILEYTKLAEQRKNKDEGENKTVYIPSEDDLNDDVPWVDEDKDKSKGPASEDERLRYARIVHNCHDNNVASRVNLLADLMGMGNKEMAGFIKEDPENAETVMSELIEIIIECNDLLAQDPTCEEFTFDYDTLEELGGSEHHQNSMKMISDARKQKYAELAQIVAVMEESKRKAQETPATDKKNKKKAA